MCVRVCVSYTATHRPVRFKCGVSKQCPSNHFSFKMASGAASVVGPKICLEDNMYTALPSHTPHPSNTHTSLTHLCFLEQCHIWLFIDILMNRCV